MTDAYLASRFKEIARLYGEVAAHYEAPRPPPAPALPNWYLIARAEIGEKEVPGDGDNPRVVEYHGATAAGEAPDAVAWCSSYCNWSLLRDGIVGTRSKAARSWENWGVELSAIYPGAILVFSRGSNPRHGHVGFGTKYDPSPFTTERIPVLGGNQRNRVSVQDHPGERLLTIRWPEGKPLPDAVA